MTVSFPRETEVKVCIVFAVLVCLLMRTKEREEIKRTTKQKMAR